MSNWKIPYFSFKNKLLFFTNLDLNISRNFVVTEGFIDKKVIIYTGKKNIYIKIKLKHVGLKFGELFFTKIIPYLKTKSKYKNKIRRKK